MMMKQKKRQQKSSPVAARRTSRSRLRSSPRLRLPRAQPVREYAAFQIRFIDPAESLAAKTLDRSCLSLRDTSAARPRRRG